MHTIYCCFLFITQDQYFLKKLSSKGSKASINRTHDRVITAIRKRILRQNMPYAKSTWLFSTATTSALYTIKQLFNYEFWCVFYPDNIFLVDLYHETLGPGANVGSYPFPFGIKFSLVSMQKPIFLIARDQASISSVHCVLSSKKLWMFLVSKWKFSEKHTFLSRSFKTVFSSTNFGSHCLSRKCRTYTLNNFSLVKWDSRNEGDLFGRAKIDTVKSCIQVLKIVLLYRRHLHKELHPGIQVPIFEGMKKFYYKRSAKKCIKYSSGEEVAGGKYFALVKPNADVAPIPDAGGASVDANVRGIIVIGSTWRCCSASRAVAESSLAVVDYLLGQHHNFLQVAGQKDAATRCAQIVQLLLANHVDHDVSDPLVAVQLDVSNAFCSVSRQHIGM